MIPTPVVSCRSDATLPHFLQNASELPRNMEVLQRLQQADPLNKGK